MGLKDIGLSGLSVSSMKKHPAIIPIYVFVGAGCVLAAGFIFRNATKNPEVSWFRNKNPEPWNDYRNKQYKLYNAGRDYSEGCPAPDYKNSP